ncbi:MAG: hypothetical protein D6775_08815 [Caldilineae bacterium]|nr:MAG: hypothetical protein D6775_08815 [Caldilineae bacterium]
MKRGISAFSGPAAAKPGFLSPICQKRLLHLGAGQDGTELGAGADAASPVRERAMTAPVSAADPFRRKARGRAAGRQ